MVPRPLLYMGGNLWYLTCKHVKSDGSKLPWCHAPFLYEVGACGTSSVHIASLLVANYPIHADVRVHDSDDVMCRRYSSVREKLDDPKYASWFIKFKGFSNTPYPGGPTQGTALF